MKGRAATSAGHRVQVGMKLARFLELREEDFAGRVSELEADVLFRRLLDVKVIAIQPYAGAGFMARRFGGWGLRTATDGVSAVLDGKGDLAEILRRVGEKRFTECFLQDGGCTDEEVARLCGIAPEEAARLRDLVNGLYVRAEFDDGPATAAPAKTYSVVAGIAVERGRPVLGFFNRQIWKGRYQVDEGRCRRMMDDLSPAEARRLEGFLRDLGLLDRRKTTLLETLEALIEIQADYLLSGELEKRRPLTQKELSDRLNVSPSVLNRLISNKSVQLPWGLEAPLKALIPSRKTVLKDRLHGLVREYPEASDAELSRMIARRDGVALSLRSIAQYRADLGLANLRRRRKPVP